MINTHQTEQIKQILSKFEPEFIGIFGSYARGDNNEESDLDILVRFGKRINLLDLIGLELELTETLGLKIDLVTEKALSPLIKESIEQDLKKIA